MADTYRPKINAAIFVTCCQVVQDLPVAFVLPPAETYGKDAMSASSMSKSHVLLQISDDSPNYRCTALRLSVVDQVIGDKNSKRIGKAGHHIYSLEVRGECVEVVRGVRIRPIDAVCRRR